MQDNFLTTRAAAELLGVSIPTVQEWVDKGRLQSWRTAGGHRRISRQSTMALARERSQSDAATNARYELPILIVEDDLSLTRLYRYRIGLWPFPTSVYIASNGYEALVLVGEMHPRIVICDLRLPGINGFGIVRGICAIPRFDDVSIVVVSGLPLAEINAHGSLPPRVHIMGKPVDFDALQRICMELSHDSSAATDR